MIASPLTARLRAWLGALACGFAAGCAPLTFSNDSSIDFAAYPRLWFDVGGLDGSERHDIYLQDELTEHSGFQHVTRDGSESVDALLWVELTLESTGVTIFHSDDHLDYESARYFATVRYRLYDAEGVALDSGLETTDDEDFAEDAAELGFETKVQWDLTRPSIRGAIPIALRRGRVCVRHAPLGD